MKLMIRAVLAAALAFAASPCWADEASCLKTGKGCSETDIDHPQAESAFQAGCKAGDFYSCTRLGQFYQVKKEDLKKALTAYEAACKGKDSYGCDALYESYMELCYLKKQKSYCGKKEPKGEYRVMAFLENFSPKFADAFERHDFTSPWLVSKAQQLYSKRIKERSRKLLRALDKEQKSKRHDGTDGEGLAYDIACLKGQCGEEGMGEE